MWYFTKLALTDGIESDCLILLANQPLWQQIRF